MQGTTRSIERANTIFHTIGIGFGPANIALAIAMAEEREATSSGKVESVFFETKSAAVWQPGMLIDDSLIQISVLKDLVTIRNPRSRFTFLNYLKEKGRLFEFLNLRDLFPTRIEFNDYISWAALGLSEYVRYGKQVVGIAPVVGSDNKTIQLLRVDTRDIASNVVETNLTKNLVLATGGIPSIPKGIVMPREGKVFHTHEFVQRMTQDFPTKNDKRRFIVVGSGQSGAELFYHLLTNYPNADVTAAIRRFAYKPVDDSDFTNEIFFPRMVDLLHSLSDEKRALFFEACRDVNYAVVDAPLIHKIYKTLYQEKVIGRDRARIRSFMQLRAASETDSGVVATFDDLLNDMPVHLEADALILATGYTWHKKHPLLEGLAPYLVETSCGRYKVERDYRLASKPSFLPKIYVQGFAEDTHGASETVLSLLAVRAMDILNSLRRA